MAARFRIQLVKATALSPSVRGLSWHVLGAPLAWEAGQSVDLFIPTSSGLIAKRTYSIACAPGHAGPHGIEIAVTRVPGGPASMALHALEVGTTLQAQGPRGSFVRHGDDRDEVTLFVATGSGLAPLRAMLQEELSRTQGPSVGLLFGCRTQVDILWADEIRGWIARHARFASWTTLSQPHPSWTGLRGYVQRHLLAVLQDLRPSRVFLCGLSPMTSEVQKLLEEANFPRGCVRTEEYDG